MVNTNVTGLDIASMCRVFTNTSSQIRTRFSASDTSVALTDFNAWVGRRPREGRMSKFVQRDAQGAVAQVLANRQTPNDEELPDDHADLRAFGLPKQRTKADRLTARMAADPELAAVVKLLAKDRGKDLQATLTDLAAEIS